VGREILCWSCWKDCSRWLYYDVPERKVTQDSLQSFGKRKDSWVEQLFQHYR
jgi:hypothetical protein